MSRPYDVAIIGAGIIGLATAYYLKKKGCSRVLVLEKESHWVTGSSARANGGFRQQFSTPVNIRMSKLSIPVFENFRDEFETNIALRRYGYLFLTAGERGETLLRRSFEIQRKEGVPVRWIEPDEIRRDYPFLRSDDLRAGTFCPRDGFADSYSIATGFGRAAVMLGTDIRLEEEVVGFRIEKGRVVELESHQGSYSAGAVVDAAGPYAGRVARLAGVQIPVEPVRRMLAMTEEFPAIPETIPMIVDLDTGFLMRKESGRVLMGWSDPQEPPGFRTDFDPAFIERLAERATLRVPGLLEARVDTRRSWAGLYEETPDHHCILGEALEPSGFFLACGFSGHGMMHAPAAGMIVADLILDGGTERIDPHPLRPGRFAEGDLIPEGILL